MCKLPGKDIPLDQHNRDWSKGNCYYTSLEFLKRSTRDLIQEAQEHIRLVHETIGEGPSLTKHAWIEVGSDLLDNSNNQGIDCPVEEYYQKNNAICIRKFTREETDAILTAKEQEDRSIEPLTWHHMTDEEVQACLDKYDPSTSPFTRNVWFSDPEDPKNWDNLIFPNKQNA